MGSDDDPAVTRTPVNAIDVPNNVTDANRCLHKGQSSSLVRVGRHGSNFFENFLKKFSKNLTFLLAPLFRKFGVHRTFLPAP